MTAPKPLQKYQLKGMPLCVVQPSRLVSLCGKAWLESNLNYKRLRRAGFTFGGPGVSETRNVFEDSVVGLTELFIHERKNIHLAIEIDPARNPPRDICGGIGLVVGLIIHQDGSPPVIVPASVSPSLVKLNGKSFFTDVETPASVVIDAILAEVEAVVVETAQ